MVLLAVMTMVAIGRPFMGTAVLLHDHHDLGIHTHEASTMALAFGGARSAVHHSDCQGGHETPHHENGPASVEDCHITVVSIDFDPNPPSQLSSTGVDAITKSLATFGVWCVLVEPHAGPEPGAPGGDWICSPRHLCALTSGERLIATSRALLI